MKAVPKKEAHDIYKNLIFFQFMKTKISDRKRLGQLNNNAVNLIRIILDFLRFKLAADVDQSILNGLMRRFLLLEAEQQFR